MESGSWKPNVEISPSCPRCGSSNTKFCYYNNYSLTQPRYFCKGCRRYWTKGGSLRNVPVGGGCRKNRRSKSLRLSSSPNNALHNKSYGYGGVMTNNHDPIRHAYSKGLVAPSIEPSSSSVVPDGFHIDLALVYANYLNPQHKNCKDSTDTNHGFEIPALPSEFDSSLETFSIALEPSNVVQVPQHQAGLVGCLTATFDDHLLIDHHQQHHDHQIALNNMDDHQLIYYSGLDSSSIQHKHQERISHDHQRFSLSHDHHDKRNPTELPPLPGEEILWPNSDHIAGLHEPPVFGNETDQDPNVLFGNWSLFDLSSTDDDTFSKST